MGRARGGDQLSGAENLNMCGILGGIDTSLNEEGLQRLHHRGPDQQFLYREHLPRGQTLALGQTRLSIVDRRELELPVTVGGARIVYNGEVYNHPELRDELIGLGWQFNTGTDIEVVLASYLQWGVECLHRFNGMFALAVWDGARFFCARDRVGKKPFFYRVTGGKFEFASEVKCFSDLEFALNDQFDVFEFCYDHHTLFRGIQSLPPGHYLVYDPAEGIARVHRYWEPERRSSRLIGDDRRAVDEFVGLLEDAVRLRLRADVPVTLFLSGGVDSALLAALSGVREVFTCQFEEFRGVIDEEPYVEDLTSRLGITAHVIRPTRSEFLEDLPAMSRHLEMPTGSFSVFPLYQLAKACSSRGYRVALSGEGSDELFGGYARNEFLFATEETTGREAERAWLPCFTAHRAPPDGSPVETDLAKRRHYETMLSRFDGTGLERFCRMAARSGLQGAARMKEALAGRWRDDRSFVDNVCRLETTIFLQPLLQMADRMGMAHHVENRCPFLDHRVIEFAFSLEDRMRYRGGIGKWIVHEAAARVLPKGAAVLKRAVKDGLATPVNLWMQGRHSFDRRFWNAIMIAECMKSLFAREPRVISEGSMKRAPSLVAAQGADASDPSCRLVPTFTLAAPCGDRA